MGRLFLGGDVPEPPDRLPPEKDLPRFQSAQADRVSMTRPRFTSFSMTRAPAR